MKSNWIIRPEGEIYGGVYLESSTNTSVVHFLGDFYSAYLSAGWKSNPFLTYKNKTTEKKPF